MLKRLMKTILWKVGFFPRFYLLENPFKIYELKVIFDCVVNDNKATIIDLGCGNGTQTILNANKFYKIIGIDPNENSIRLAKDKLTFAHGNGKIEFFANTIEGMHFPADSIDGVVSYCVLEHIRNYDEVLNELYRILKPGGWLLFSVDSLAVIRESVLLEKHRCEHHVVKYFTIKEMNELLLEKRFKNITVEPKLKSKFAEKLFTKGIHNHFQFNKLSGLIYTGWLFVYERFARRENEGLFLLVKAYK
ncbi:MAG: class I SAM-dependent methyltransferase [Candidatus Brocadiaceae bacterium]